MIGARLRDQRERLGLNQRNVAAFLGTTARTVIKWEANETSPNARDLCVLSSNGFDIFYIVTGIKYEQFIAETMADEYATPARRAAADIAAMKLADEDAELVIALARRLMTKG